MRRGKHARHAIAEVISGHVNGTEFQGFDLFDRACHIVRHRLKRDSPACTGAFAGAAEVDANQPVASHCDPASGPARPAYRTAGGVKLEAPEVWLSSHPGVVTAGGLDGEQDAGAAAASAGRAEGEASAQEEASPGRAFYSDAFSPVPANHRIPSDTTVFPLHLTMPISSPKHPFLQCQSGKACVAHDRVNCHTQ
jgi:hypothetical protein